MFAHCDQPEWVCTSRLRYLYGLVLGDSQPHAELELCGERFPDLLDGPVRQRSEPPRHFNHLGHKLVQVAVPEQPSAPRHAGEEGGMRKTGGAENHAPVFCYFIAVVIYL